MSNPRNSKAIIQIVMGMIATFIIFNTIVFATFINLNYSILNVAG
jgi:hypothetical protein